MIKTNKSAESQQLPCLVDQITGISLKTPIQIANKFNNHFTNLKLDSEISDFAAKKFIQDQFCNLKRNNLIKDNSFSFKIITREIVLESVTKLDSTSSFGVTMIPTAILKHSSEILAPIFVIYSMLV